MAKSGNLVPLIILVVVLGVVAVVGFMAYSIAHEVGHKTRQRLERKNVSFSKDGMKVGVKHVSQEQQEDAAQSVLTKVWNNAELPNYKSPVLGWGQGNKTPTPVEKRNPFSRHSSSTQSAPTLSRQTSNQNNLSRTTSAQNSLT